jgi:TPR repeat protein
MNQLGYAHYAGVGCEKNNSDAFEWYKRSAELGHRGAMLGLNLVLHSTATDYDTEAAAKGDECARAHLETLAAVLE